MTTRIEVSGDPVRPVVSLRGGLLRPRRLPDRDGAVRVALVATTALLLAGDDVGLDVRVGPGLRLDVVETAGTVAYGMRGGSARWDLTVRLAPRGVLTWAGLPFVVADGAVVERTTDVELGPDAVAVLRESLVLGRTGEQGGVLDGRTRVRLADRPLLRESLRLDPAARDDPAVLAGARCLDTVAVLGSRLPDGPDVLQLDGPGSLARCLTDQQHRSGLDQVFAVACSQLGRHNVPAGA